MSLKTTNIIPHPTIESIEEHVFLESDNVRLSAYKCLICGIFFHPNGNFYPLCESGQPHEEMSRDEQFIIVIKGLVKATDLLNEKKIIMIKGLLNNY